jgi:hypothetical protein
MSWFSRLTVSTFVALSTLFGSSSPAHAEGPASAELGLTEKGGREIRRPLVIDRPGRYYLGRDLQAGTDTAVRIVADDVTLDLAGHRIVGPGNRQGTGIAVVGASNVRISGGSLGSLGTGVLLENATNVVVEQLQIDGDDLGGPPPTIEIGILVVNTRGARITHNVITDTFLGIFVRGNRSSGNRIAANLITGGANGELGICYNPAPGETAPAGPDGDLIYDNVVARFRRGLSFSAGSAGNQVLDNHLAYFDIAIEEGAAGENLVEGNSATPIVR